jgi:hypothetical protein
MAQRTTERNKNIFESIQYAKVFRGVTTSSEFIVFREWQVLDSKKKEIQCDLCLSQRYPISVPFFLKCLKTSKLIHLSIKYLHKI